ncbi:MAG: hypothetical protein HYT36_03010 [Candidatus Staskawiczbacteria bacterium]|nr:hypothetical protein [Candidatus Staskawiczbacteria bacterium]
MDYSLNEYVLDDLGDRLKLLFLPGNRNGYCPKFFQGKFLTYCVICLLFLKMALAGFHSYLPKEIFFADITKVDLNNLVNKNRKDYGLNPLVENEKLDRAAYLKARDMVEKQYFSHQSPGGQSPWDWFLEAGYNYKFAGENLAIGFVDSNDVYKAWFNSKEHRENILNPNFREIGTAVAPGFGENKANVAVQFFGSQAESKSRLTSLVQNSGSDKNSKNAAEEQDKDNEDEASPRQINIFSFSKKPEDAIKSGFYYRILSFMVYDSEIILRNIIYSLLFMTIAGLAIWSFSGNARNHKNILLRSVILMLLLFAGVMI